MELAKKNSLDFFGVVNVGPESRFTEFSQWIQEGFHADMKWFEKNQKFRENPSRLLPGSKNILVFGLNYFQGDKGIHPSKPRIAQYARLRDYHKTFKNYAEAKLKIVKSQKKNEYTFIENANGDLSNGILYLGFNISRSFTLKGEDEKSW